MALVSDEVAVSTSNDEPEFSTLHEQLPTENLDDRAEDDISTSGTSPIVEENNDDKEEEEEEEAIDEQLASPLPPTLASTEVSNEPPRNTQTSTTSDACDERPILRQSESADQKRQARLKSRSVSFAPTVDEFEIPARSSFSSGHRPTDFIDALVESYLLQSSANFYPVVHEEKKYVPKTSRSRLIPNWREHRTRRLMNKLEAMSLWDREEEMKASQAQFLREQKLEQIQDRQRNHDLCLHLMRQRHESEMESAVLLDRAASGINEENTRATIAQAMQLASPANVLAYSLPAPPQSLKRRVRQEQEQVVNAKTPLGRFRQFETSMDNKAEKINQKLKPDLAIMRAYSPACMSIPPNVVPLFSETYAAILAIPDTYTPNKYNQYHYGVASYLHKAVPHAPSPDYETRVRSYSNRDVRVPFKDHLNDSIHLEDDDADYNRRSFSSRISASPTRRAGHIVSSTATSLYDHAPPPPFDTSRDYSFIHSRQPISSSIHHRSLNDDLIAITRFSLDTSKKPSANTLDLYGDASIDNRASSSSSRRNQQLAYIDYDNENFAYHPSSARSHQPEILSLSATR